MHEQDSLTQLLTNHHLFLEVELRKCGAQYILDRGSTELTS